MVYLDYCATTPVDEEVSKLMNQVGREIYGNPSSLHKLGQKARSRIEIARRQVAKAIGATPSEVVFTGSGSESNNIILWDVIQRRGKHIIISSVEHDSIYKTAYALRKLGIEITEVGVDNNGRVEPHNVVTAMKPETSLVAIMTANNETGTVQPIEEIAHLCQGKKVHIHTDAIQALGKINVDFQNNGPDTASFSSHKLYGPKGVGALYIKRGIKLHPLLYGGGQELTLRSGTENVSGIAGFGLACDLKIKNMPNESIRLEMLRNLMLKRILSDLKSAKINGDSNHYLPGIMSLNVPNVDAQTLLMKLDLNGFAISTGAACSSGATKPSRALLAMGLNDDDCKSTFRVSLGRYTTEDDITSFLDCLLSQIRLMTVKNGSKSVS